jgi:hypothetical protein
MVLRPIGKRENLLGFDLGQTSTTHVREAMFEAATGVYPVPDRRFSSTPQGFEEELSSAMVVVCLCPRLRASYITNTGCIESLKLSHFLGDGGRVLDAPFLVGPGGGLEWGGGGPARLRLV